MARLSKTGGKAGNAKARKAKGRKAGPAKGSKTAKANSAKAKAARSTRRAAPAARALKRSPVADLAEELKEAREQQAATAEILKVINSSKGDLTPVFDVILEKAHRLCDVTSGSLQLLQDDKIRAVAVRGMTESFEKILRQGFKISDRLRRSINPDRPVHTPDITELLATAPDEPAFRAAVDLEHIRTTLSVALAKDGIPLGRIVAARKEIRPFTGKQIALLQGFADQAVIAIENARLFNETQEALERQTATADILKVIASSPDDIQPVFEAIAERSNRLVDGFATIVLSIADGTAYLSAFTPTTPAADAALKVFYPQPLSALTWTEAVLSGKTYLVTDTEVELAKNPAALEISRKRGWRSALFVPLLRDRKPVGVIGVTRADPGPFADHHVQLLQTFADQAVIAISNVGLFQEVKDRTRDLTEALAHQTGSSNVLRVIASSPTDIEPVLEAIVESARELCEANDAVVLLKDGDHLRFSAHSGPIPVTVEKWPIGRGWTAGLAFLDRKPVHVRDMLSEEGAAFPDARKMGQSTGAIVHTVLSVPLLSEQESIGAILLRRTEVRPFNDKQVDLLQTFADQAVIAISNVGLFKEVQARTRELSESLQQQTATADVLRIISRSVAHAAPVFDTILESCQRLFDPYDAAVYLVEGDRVRGVAQRGARVGDWGADSMPLEGSSTGVAIAQRRPIHFPDLADKADLPEDKRAVVKEAGGMSVLYAPMISQDSGVGSLVVTRRPKQPFTEAEIGLIQTFADQAVIAIENARLFDEVQARTRELSESLQQQTATSDVLKVISRSTFDLQTVLETLVKSAVELSGANRGSIFLREGDVFPLKAASHTTPEFLQYWAANPPRAGRGSATNRGIASGKVEIIPDVLEDPEMQMPAGALVRIRATLGVPMLRDNKVEGVLVLTRPEPGLFSKSQIDLVQTFADQAVIAVENVRLFDEAQARTRELAASLEDLRTAQDRLVQTEKLASLGQLTAGIAHEIKNPLNFVNNFSSLSTELIDELDEALAPVALDQKTRDEVGELTAMLKSNLEKVVQHGKRADSIVKNMLLHSREGSGEHRAADINGLVEESLSLAYHGARAEKPSFNITLIRDLDPEAGAVDLYPQEITRALLNFITNGFYATARRKAETADESFEPALHATTKNLGKAIEIRIRDNGTGIPPEVREKMFNPFFTTKPAGEGTGLGLSMSHDIIVKQHGGRIEVETEPGAFTEFIVTLPRNGTAPRA